jgi:hypothetical protein
MIRKFLEPLAGQPTTGPMQFGTASPGLFVSAAVCDAWRARLQECTDNGEVTADVLDELLELFSRPQA